MNKNFVIMMLSSAGLALMLGMVACTAPPPRSSGKAVDPIVTSPLPVDTSKPASQGDPVGRWQLDMFMVYDLQADGAISARAVYEGAEVYQGTWQTLPDGRIVMSVGSMGEMTATLRGNVLVAGESPDSDMTTVLRRVDAQGNLLPADITTSDVPLPLFDPSQVTVVKIDKTWVGLSPNAPYVSQITLTLSSDPVAGDAFYSKGYSKPVTSTASITVPASAVSEALGLWSQTPVEAGVYRPFINHTDDYPHIRIELTLPDGNVVFDTRSQGEDNLPWQVILSGKEYVTFSDLPSAALKVLDPFITQAAQ